jgi:hypothetical protein
VALKPDSNWFQDSLSLWERGFEIASRTSQEIRILLLLGKIHYDLQHVNKGSGSAVRSFRRVDFSLVFSGWQCRRVHDD